jgi:hypothetical protein
MSPSAQSEDEAVLLRYVAAGDARGLIDDFGDPNRDDLLRHRLARAVRFLDGVAEAPFDRARHFLGAETLLVIWRHIRRRTNRATSGW